VPLLKRKKGNVITGREKARPHRGWVLWKNGSDDYGELTPRDTSNVLDGGLAVRDCSGITRVKVQIKPRTGRRR